MKLIFNRDLSYNYHSNSQKIRVLSEDWFLRNMFCPCCGNLMVNKFTNNSPVADFYCDNCKEQFELKSTNKPIHQKITDGAYDTAIQRITSNINPDLFVMQYENYEVKNLTLIPKYFFTPSIIEKRKPLSDSARRAGWVGCNILYGQIPDQGKIKIIENGSIREVNDVVASYQRTYSLNSNNIELRGWLFDVLNCINAIPNDMFTLNDIYNFEDILKIKHPNNTRVREKIRQQLQFLRDKGYLEFVNNRGVYRKMH